jgi:hypothetical protein
MANVSLWSSVGVAVQSAIAAAKTISGITKAAPGVVTASSHGYSAGDYILLSVQGMSELDGRVIRVGPTGVTTDAFQMLGDGGTAIDTTNFGTFTSGSAYKLTMGTTLATVLDFSGSGGDFEYIDVTTIHDPVRKQIPGASSPATFNGTLVWDPADAGFVALKAASDTKAQRAVLISFANGQKFAFNGYVGVSGAPTGAAQDKVTTPMTMTSFGKLSFFTT